MKKIRFILTAFLVAGLLAWSQSAMAATQVSTVSSLMKVLREDNQKAVYNVNLNAPFNKDTSGVRENVSTETGEVSVTNTVFEIPGRNGMDLELNLEYRSRDAKGYAEGTRSGNAYNNYGQNVIAWYDMFDSAGYWLKTGGLIYTPYDTILSETTIDGNRWVFTGNMQYENGTSLFTSGDIVNTTVEFSRDKAANYIFGEGWNLDIPSLDVDNDTVWVNLPDGQTYKADFTTGIGLADYELTDIVFSVDTGYGNGTSSSKYKLYYATGDAYYFSDKGELLVKMDRFRNAIRYYWEDVNGLRVLTKIVDSVGRAVDIQYNDSVTIIKSGGRSVRLMKTAVPGQVGKYYLSSFIDAQGREFRYKYTFQDAAFDQVGKPAVNNQYANLIEISYPTGAKTQYVWEKGKKNIGASGYMEYFKVKERKDIDGDRTYNRLTYQWFNEPDGYPTYKANAIDELYKYSSTVTDSKGLTTKYMFNSKHLPYFTQQYSTRLLNETFTQYHAKYKLPVRVVSKDYNAAGDVFEKRDTYDYDHRGNVIAENHPEKPDEENSDEHKVSYSYDFEYNLMESNTFKQDKETTVEVRYDLSSDKKTVAAQSIFGNGKILNRAEYAYDGYGNLTETRVEKEPEQWVATRFGYSDEYKGGYLTAIVAEDVRDADGNTRDIRTQSTYDFATGNILTNTDANGNTTSYEYDALDRILHETLPDKANRSYTYNDADNILEVTNANGNRLTYYYDGLGKLVRITEPAKGTDLVELDYDDNENLVSETDGNKNLKQLAYDELTRITGVSHYDRTGKIMADTRVSYDEALHERFGQIFFKVTVTNKGDRNDRTANYYFDTYDRLAKLGRFNKGKEEFARCKYDYLGKQIEAVDFAGQKSAFQYDALGQLIKATDAQGSSMKYTYDRLGDIIAQTDALGRTAYFEYDNLGRRIMTKATFEAGKYSVSKYFYDPAGNLVKTVDPDGYVGKQHFNSRNFLTAVEQVINAKKSNITGYDYDREGNTTKVIKGLNSFNDPDFSEYTYNYDQLNRLIKMTDASSRETFYEYDDNGNLAKLTDRNKVETTYTYDGLNRLVQKKNSKDGKKNAVQITFDKLGQARRMSDASGTTVFDYDELGRLTKIDYGNGIRQSYAYDKADRVSNLLVTQGSLKHINLGYQYDKVGRLTTVNDNGKRFNYKYNAIGQLIEEINGVTGIHSSYQYYPSGNIKSLRHWNGEDLFNSYEYKYDMRGNQIEKNEGTGTTKYYYDALSRIKTAIEPDKTQNYEYDDLDNIKELAEIKGNKIELTSYQYDKDSRLLLQETNKGTETIQRRFTYDGNGNQLTKDEVTKRNGSTVTSKNWDYWYDGFNQLTRVKNPDNKFTDYTYNGQGLRTKKDFGDKSINYYYNGGNIILETNQSDKVTARNIWGLRIICRENNPGQTDSQLLYYLHNAHGDVTQLLNDKGQVIKDYRYDAFGKEEMPEDKVFGGKQTTELWRQEVEKIDNPFRYCGEYLDEETGNYYLRARYYDPSVQRFTQEDSFGVFFGAMWRQQPYNYAGNNPINRFDPTGHIVTDWDTKNCTDTQLASIAEASVEWQEANSKGDEAGMAAAHAKANAARAASGHLNNGETVDSSGYVHTSNGRRATVTLTSQQKEFVKQINGKINALAKANYNGKWASKWIVQNKKTTSNEASRRNEKSSLWDDFKRGISGIVDIPKIVSSGVKQTWNDPNTMKALKQTGGAIVLGVVVKATAVMGAVGYVTAGGGIMYMGNIAADVVAAPPPNSFLGYIGSKALDAIGVNPLDILFGGGK